MMFNNKNEMPKVFIIQLGHHVQHKPLIGVCSPKRNYKKLKTKQTPFKSEILSLLSKNTI